MFVRDDDIQAYERVSSLENLLRRVLRWELRGSFGREWFSKLGAFGSIITDRIANEKIALAYNADHSELAYLDFNELLDLIFDQFWKTNFEAILVHRRLKAIARSKIVTVRNKVAHFRSINQNDLLSLDSSADIYDALKKHYETRLNADAYLPAEDPESQLDEAEIDLLKTCLSRYDASRIWDEYSKVEAVRSIGLSPGIGVIGQHLFLELFTEERFLPNPLMQFAKKQRFEVTYMHFGLKAKSVRLFVPLKLGAIHLSRIVHSFVAAARMSNSKQPSAEPLSEDGFDFGYWEHVGAPGRAMYFGLVF